MERYHLTHTRFALVIPVDFRLEEFPKFVRFTVTDLFEVRTDIRIPCRLLPPTLPPGAHLSIAGVLTYNPHRPVALTVHSHTLTLEFFEAKAPRRPERHFHRSEGFTGFTFDYGFLAEDFDPGQLSETNGYYRLPVQIEDRDPSSDQVETWVLTIPAKILTPRRRARLRPLAEVLFVAHLFYAEFDDPSDEDLDNLYGVPVVEYGLRAHVVRFAVVTARRRARTRYVRHRMQG